MEIPDFNGLTETETKSSLNFHSLHSGECSSSDVLSAKISNITFVTAFYKLYEEEDEPYQHKTMEWRIENFRVLAKSGIKIIIYSCEKTREHIRILCDEFPDNLFHGSLQTPYEETEIYKMCMKKKEDGSPQLELPSNRNSKKDTYEYLTLMNCKIEFVKDAIIQNHWKTSYFAWMDFSMAYLFSDKENTSKLMLELNDLMDTDSKSSLNLSERSVDKFNGLTDTDSKSSINLSERSADKFNGLTDTDSKSSINLSEQSADKLPSHDYFADQPEENPVVDSPSHKEDDISTLKPEEKMKQTRVLAFPGCWEKIPSNYYIMVKDHISWRFCGTFFMGDSQSILEMYDYYVEHFPRFTNETNKLVWEVNIWAWLEANTLWKPQWYASDHNDRLITDLNNFLLSNSGELNGLTETESKSIINLSERSVD